MLTRKEAVVDWPNPEGGFGEPLPVEHILSRDPSGIYNMMDESSKHLYREAVRDLAGTYGVAEAKICETALELSLREVLTPQRQKPVTSHIGFYILDPQGVLRLLDHLCRGHKYGKT